MCEYSYTFEKLSFFYVPLVQPLCSGVSYLPLPSGWDRECWRTMQFSRFHSQSENRLALLASERELHHSSVEDEPETKLLS